MTELDVLAERVTSGLSPSEPTAVILSEVWRLASPDAIRNALFTTVMSPRLDALDTEIAVFRKGELYGSLAGGGRQKATTSFQLGLSRGISAKHNARKRERDSEACGAGPRFARGLGGRGSTRECSAWP